MVAKTNVQATSPRGRTPAAPSFTAMAVVAPAIGWLVPGTGHLVQKRWVRGGLLLASVLIMFCVGLAMQGKVYSPNAGDILEILGFIGDLGSGGLYFASRALGWGQGAVYRATADYGTKYIIVAGLLNIISAVDAYHIAIGKKQ
jgi:hypothetical protein